MEPKQAKECQKTIDELSCDKSIIVEADQPRDSIAQFYLKERKKVNIWTHLFKELAKTLDQIVRMCELEAKPEFCRGVKETLKAGVKELDKVEHKIKLEQGQSSQSCAWEVPASVQSPENVLRELRGSALEGLFDEEDLIEFSLLSELVNEGRMGFYDAIVLVIRERALISSEVEQRDQLRTSRYNFVDRSARASSTPLPIAALINRVNLKLKAVDSSKHQSTSEKLKQKLERANTNRALFAEQRRKSMGRHAHRVERIKDEQTRQLDLKTQLLASKHQGVSARRCEKIEELRKKTSDYRMKASEVCFLMLLEQQSRQKQLDSKLENTRRRRIKIVEKIQSTLRENSNAEAVLSRKEELESDRQQMLRRRMDRLEEAAQRRLEMLELRRAAGSRKVKKDALDVKTKAGPINYVVEDLLEAKELLDRAFAKMDFDKLIKVQREYVMSQSYDFESGVCQTEISLDNSLVEEDKDDAENKKKGRKRKRKHKKAKEPEDVREQKDNTLQSYYRFLTKDSEYLESRKRAKKHSQAISVAQMKARTKLALDSQISELPELICRELAKKVKPDSKYNLCTLCNAVIDSQAIEEHINSKAHKKHRNGAKNVDDAQVIIVCDEQEMIAQRFNALKRKCKKVKHYIEVACLKNEAGFNKDTASGQNRARLQKLTLELEKQVNSQKKDYEAIANILSEVHKVTDKNNEPDFVLLRQVRFISVMIELFKCSHFCLKFELQNFVEILNEHFKILNKLSVLRDNRLYMILTNKVVPIVEILSWSWSHSSKAIEALDYIPQALHLLTFLFKQKLEPDQTSLRTNLAEYVLYCGFFVKVRQRFLAFNLSADTNGYSPKVSMLVTKTLNFLEVVTDICQRSDVYVMDESIKHNDNARFVLKETEFAGCLHLLATVLLSKGQFHRNAELLPQFCFSHAFYILRIFNNIARGDIKLVQTFLSGNSFNSDQFYHVCLFLFDYCVNNIGKIREVIDILQELIILIGYFSLMSVENQNILSRGTVTHTLIYKLCKLPSKIYFTISLFKELLFPTIIAVVYCNEANLKIFKDEGHLPVLLKYLQQKTAFYNEATDREQAKAIYRGQIVAAIEKNKELLNLSITNPDFYDISNRFPVDKLDTALAFLNKHTKTN